jgi:hypothetical protein
MSWSRPSRAFSVLAIGLAFALGACAQMNLASFGIGSSQDTPPPAPSVAPSVRTDDLVGRWGVASFQKPEDRTRTETAARGQCGQPVTITKGPGGGVMMYLNDNPKLQELTVKANSAGTYIGPPNDEAGGTSDREVTSFDGRVMVLRWIDPEVASRYGTTIYARCQAPGMPVARAAGKPTARQ